MKSKLKKKVFCAMSGGVDSSVAAALLKKQGYEVIGAHMKCWSGSPSTSLRAESCSAEQDSEDARRAAEVLNIPFYVFDFEKEYKEKVVEYMVDGYRQGITPNPDVMCNKEIKFGLFLKKALEMGADYIATGHYVRLRRELSIINDQLSSNGSIAKFSKFDNSKIENSLKIVNCKLKIAKDKNKDQSYFLWTLTQEQLKRCLFPVGDYLKPEIRAMARKLGLPNADKKDSQGICFLGQVTLKDFLGNYLPKKKGLVLNTSGQVIGEHQGAHFYTIGQRHIGFNQQPTTNNQQPLYVAEKDVQENALLVAEGGDDALYQKEIALSDVNFINFSIPHIRTNKGYKVLARVRYRQPLAPAKLYEVRLRKVKLVFDRPQKFVASGQSAVIYSKNGEIFGGGVIGQI